VSPASMRRMRLEAFDAVATHDANASMRRMTHGGIRGRARTDRPEGLRMRATPTPRGPGRPGFLLVLRAEPWCEDHNQALRAALRVLLRRFGLRCLSVKEEVVVAVAGREEAAQ
jgi:hypothetical protein